MKIILNVFNGSYVGREEITADDIIEIWKEQNITSAEWGDTSIYLDRIEIEEGD